MEEIHRLDKEVAELKGQILTEIRHLSHDIKNMMQAMGAFVPRPEVERMMADLKAKIDENKKEQDKRHDEAETNRKNLRNIAFSAVAMALAGWAITFLKH